jgi:hypothetical protein
VRVPDPDRATVILIVQGGQEESRMALTALTPPPATDAQVVIIARGEVRGDEVQSRPYLVLADPDGAMTAKLDVHGWPTALVIDKVGMELARVGGTAASLAVKLKAYTDSVAGRIDAATARQVATRPTVAGDAAVERAIATSRANGQAEALLAANRISEAKAILQQIVAADPRSSRSHYLLGRALELEGDHAAAAREYRAALDVAAGR